MIRRLAIAALAMTIAALPTALAHAQTAPEWLAKGNAAYDARNASAALAAYQHVLAIDPENYDALWRASRSQTDLASADPPPQDRAAMYKTAADEAARAVQANPNGADGHFVYAEALGRMALTLGARDRVKYAAKVRDQAMECLKIEPQHSGCLHVMGVWNAEVMRLNGFTRMIARNFMGGQVFDEASWQNARRYLEESVTNDPRRIVHRLDLARVYADMGLKAQSKTEYEAVVSGELIDYNDPLYKAAAADSLKKM